MQRMMSSQSFHDTNKVQNVFKGNILHQHLISSFYWAYNIGIFQDDIIYCNYPLLLFLPSCDYNTIKGYLFNLTVITNLNKKGKS